MKGFFVDISTVFEIDCDTDTVEMSCPAEYFYSPDEIKIVYDEYAQDCSQIHTTVTVKGDSVWVERSGSVRLNMMLREGLSGSDKYELGENMIIIDYFADTVRTELDENGGRVYLSYRLDIGGVASKNSIEIKIKKTV